MLMQLASANITTLTLSGVAFLNLAHVQSFVCALPKLSDLSIRRIVYNNTITRHANLLPLTSRSLDAEYRLASPPALSFLCFEPELASVATFEVAAWLGNGPSTNTLKSLLVPYSSISPQAILKHFGPTVSHLALPLRTLDRSAAYGHDQPLSGYTNLGNLTIFMDSYNDHQGSWYLLPVFLERYLLSQHLRVLAIEVHLDYPTRSTAILDWTALDHLNDVLDDEKFELLEKVEFKILLKKVCWDLATEMAMLLHSVEGRLYIPAAAGKLFTRYERIGY
ncbi:hypothetical protein BD311DRAFT_677230 [Dichomitus squalens]|uniref:F-box domain-containing protein n=1 Tax=Dichomitus squalens TaxID=114155 RepID=A0A4Q9M4Z1_9APHY|nr:hypothetical protein BD311DRAFT_677230 [Dichomitus squalens]TBU52091.1 hypothetical protein BD310DRAFT_952918 [Dichomitus squalens]